jgi:hypothetical protein
MSLIAPIDTPREVILRSSYDILEGTLIGLTVDDTGLWDIPALTNTLFRDDDVAITFLKTQKFRRIKFRLCSHLITRRPDFAPQDDIPITVFFSNINPAGPRSESSVTITTDKSESNDNNDTLIDILSIDFPIDIGFTYRESQPVISYQDTYNNQKYEYIYIQIEFNLILDLPAIEKPLSKYKMEKQNRKIRDRIRDRRRRLRPALYKLGDHAQVNTEIDDETLPVWYEIIGKDHKDYLGQVLPFQGLEDHVQLKFEEEQVLESRPPRNFQGYREFNRIEHNKINNDEPIPDRRETDRRDHQDREEGHTSNDRQDQEISEPSGSGSPDI